VTTVERTRGALPASDAVTIILTSYNHEDVLEDAFASVVAQDHPRLSLIVTDDASTDASVAVIEDLLARTGLSARTIFHRANKGLCATLNEALALVDTSYVLHLSGDDWMAPQRVSTQVAALAAEPGAALVYGDAWIAATPSDEQVERFSDHFDEDWHSLPVGDLFKNLLRTDWIPAPSVMSRTDCLRAVGGFDEDLPVEDYDMWLRLAAAGYPFVRVEHPLVTWRRAGVSQTDVLNRRSAVEKDVLDLRVWGKHLGVDDDIDSWLAPRLAHIAVASLKKGSRSPVITQTLRSCLRARRDPSTLRYLLIARLRQRDDG
jgi:glycosyltransferase involved in cell wall biosynthesis